MSALSSRQLFDLRRALHFPVAQRGANNLARGCVVASIYGALDFAVTIDNPNTRAAYFHACRRFLAWCDPREDTRRSWSISSPMRVAAYIRGLGKEYGETPVSETPTLTQMQRDISTIV